MECWVSSVTPRTGFLSKSESIYEAEEFDKIEQLQSAGKRALSDGDGALALHFYNEALEIDGANAESLCGRSLAFLLTEAVNEARQDANSVMSLAPQNPRGYYLQALCLEHEMRYEDSLKALLRAFNLRTADDSIISERILSVAQKCLKEPPAGLHKGLTGDKYDDFETLCEAGKTLLAAEIPDLAVDVLAAAAKVNGRKTHSAVAKQQLLIGKALVATENLDAAISSFKDCLKSCESLEGSSVIRVEALLQLAAVCMKVGDLLHGIICYETLLDMANEPSDQSAGMIFFLCGVHLNLSVAYRTVGDLELARHHARLAHAHCKADLQSPLCSEVQLNLGILAEAVGDCREAVAQFEHYRKLCKQLGDKNGLMTSYGCLGNVYARLDCYNLAAAYHNRQITLADNLSYRSARALAKEMEGDSMVLLRRHSAAVRSYEQMLRLCDDGLILSKVGGYFKLGKAYLFDKKDSSARICFEKALTICAKSGSGFDRLINQIELSLASIMMDSDDQEDLENAQQIYNRQILNLELELSLQSVRAIESRMIELKMQLKECSHALVCICSNMENYRDALFQNERLNFLMVSGKPITDVLNHYNEDVIEKLISIAGRLKCCVVYYFLLPKVLLIWFLSADGKIEHVRRYAGENMNIISEARSLIKSSLSYLSSDELLYSAENRALPLKQTDFQTSPGTQKFGGEILLPQSSIVAKSNRVGCKIRSGNDGSGFETSECLNAVGLSDTDTCGKNKVEWRSQTVSGELETDSAERRLYDLLVSPVETVLQNMCVADDHIIIVPCEELSRCPFWSLCNKDGLALGMMYNVTVTGSLLVLNTTAINSERDLQTGLDLGYGSDAQDIFTERSFGDFPNNFASFVPTRRWHPSEGINPRRTSNPRLAVLSSCRHLSPNQKKRKRQSDVAPLQSCADMIRPQEPASSVREELEGESLSSQNQNFVVIGSPSLPKCVILDGRQSTLILEESRMKAECVMVADLLGTNCVTGPEATKDCFLQHLKTANILHIATLVSPERGDLAMSPNTVPALDQQAFVDEALYLVKADEIMATKTSVKLVVISGGWSVVSHRGVSASQVLAYAFLSAGACCVLGIMYPVPSEVLICFYEGFYRALLGVNGKVSTAFRMATDHVNTDERFKKSGLSSAFALIGVDAVIDVKSVSRSMILQSIARAKDLFKKEAELPNSSVDAHTTHPEWSIHKIQRFLSSLLLMTSAKSELLLHLTEMLEEGFASSCASKPQGKSMILPDDLCQNVVAIKLLQFLGFTFQPPEGASISHPYVVVPCSDDSGLIRLCLEALRALTVLASDWKCLMAIQQLLPVSPALAGDVANLLSLYEFDPAGEVRTTDRHFHIFSIWKATKIRTLLMSVGFHCIGDILRFRNTAKNRNLLHETCRLLKLLLPCAALSSDNETVPPPHPVLCFGGSWATEVESSVRMEEKIQLSSRVKEEHLKMRSDLIRAKTWHKAAAEAQGRDVLHRKYSKPFVTQALKVKVVGGSTPSQTRIPVDHEVVVDLKEMEQRRDYSHFVYTRRLNQVKTRHQGTISNLVLPQLIG